MKRILEKFVFCVYVAVMVGWGGSGAFCQETIQPATNKPLKIGLIPERNIFKQIEHYQPLLNYLEKKIDNEITLKILTRYGNIVDNFVALDLDAAFFGSFTYTLAHEKLGVQVLVRPETNSGVSTYHGLIFTRKDSGITGVAGMEGKTFAFVDMATTAGYILPLAYFKRNGIQDFKTFFKETYFSGTHEDAINDVLNKKADLGAAKNTIFSGLAAENDRIITELAILERSPDVPENGLAVRKDLDSTIKIKLKQALLNMNKDPEGKTILKDIGARAFIETSDSDYYNVLKMVNEIGLNLKTYNYSNQ